MRAGQEVLAISQGCKYISHGMLAVTISRIDQGKVLAE